MQLLMAHIQGANIFKNVLLAPKIRPQTAQGFSVLLYLGYG